MYIPGGASGKKNPPANEGDARDAGWIPGSERSPGGGNGNPLQCSCLGNPMDKKNPGGYSLWGCIESSRTEGLSTHIYVHICIKYVCVYI